MFVLWFVLFSKLKSAKENVEPSATFFFLLSMNTSSLQHRNTFHQSRSWFGRELPIFAIAILLGNEKKNRGCACKRSRLGQKSHFLVQVTSSSSAISSLTLHLIGCRSTVGRGSSKCFFFPVKKKVWWGEIL